MKSQRKKIEGYNQASKDGFYVSKEWKALRLLKLGNNPICERCVERGYTTSATIVNHIRPVDKFPELKLDYTNLESVCKRCHEIITRQDNSRYNRFNMKQGQQQLKNLNDY